MTDHAAAIWHIAHTATQSRRQDLLAALVAQTGWVVQAGRLPGWPCPNVRRTEIETCCPNCWAATRRN